MTYLLDNYRQLITRIDALCGRIESVFGEQITCSEGCSSCCTAISLFPVEAAALRDSLNALPDHAAESIRQHVSKNASGERCPLLSHNRCLLYTARPIICRTHGLPIIYIEDHKQKSDCCPRNLTETESVSGVNAIDLDKLNALLVAVNALYMSQAEVADYAGKLTIPEAVKRE